MITDFSEYIPANTCRYISHLNQVIEKTLKLVYKVCCIKKGDVLRFGG